MTQMPPIPLAASTNYPEPDMAIPGIMPHHLDIHINLAIDLIRLKRRFGKTFRH